MKIRKAPFPLALALAIGSLGCDEPEADCFRSEGCAAPDPRGVITGTVLYVGPRPICERGEAGALIEPVRVQGQVVLTLFEFDNPPPPSGSATSALNLLTVPGDVLFGELAETDCMPADPTPEERAVAIMRSTPFTWPEIELGLTYQIRGFYDYDGDFNPFFSVRNLPTRGDIAGGAFVSTSAVPPQFLPIVFGPEEERPEGEVVSGVAITLGAPVVTERPMFRYDAMPLNAESTIPATSDAAERERLLWELTMMRVHLIGDADEEYAAALEAAGIDFDFDPLGYSWFIQDVDANNDGMPDPHPILGAGGVMWKTPIVIVQRFRNEIELAARIPNVLFIASVRPTQTLIKTVHRPSLDIVVPPVAALQLNPGNDQCAADLRAEMGATAVPILAPATPFTSLLERIPVDCQEMPTGEYNVNVLHGIAGGTLQTIMAPPGTLSDACGPDPAGGGGTVCFNWQNGRFSSQAWSIPNDLGNPLQLCEDPAAADCPARAVADDQGPEARFVVYDPSPANGADQNSADCQMAIDPTMMPPAERAVVYRPIPASCCDGVRHLCGLPLCDTREVDGQTIRQSPTSVDEAGVPNCVPFPMPVSCCE